MSSNTSTNTSSNTWKWIAIGCAAAAGVAAAIALHRQYTQRRHKTTVESILAEYEESFSTPTSKLKSLVDALNTEMHSGLVSDGGSRLKMLVSYVDELPNGNEKGTYYALDLGGTNFRVLRVKLGGKEKRVEKTESEECSIPEKAMRGTTEELFDFIAGEVAKFVKKEEAVDHPATGKTREMGFTFSFPVTQHAINAGSLIKWTKGFDVSGTVGKDVVKILQDAFKRAKVEMHVAALVNDTVGTLAGGRYTNDNVMLGLILGTGTNACYVEAAKEIPKWEGDKSEGSNMVINMEWGNFYSNHLPVTDVDTALDAESMNPGEQIFEKMISGMYLGEIVRRILLRLAEEGHLFGPVVPKLLREPYRLSTPQISKMHADSSPDLQTVGSMISERFGVDQVSPEVRHVILDVIALVVARGARLAGAGICGVLKKIGRDGSSAPKNPGFLPRRPSRGEVGKNTTVAVDGGLYEHYPFFRSAMQDAMEELLGTEGAKFVKLELTKDGSGIGAALLAATYAQGPTQ